MTGGRRDLDRRSSGGDGNLVAARVRSHCRWPRGVYRMMLVERGGADDGRADRQRESTYRLVHPLAQADGWNRLEEGGAHHKVGCAGPLNMAHDDRDEGLRAGPFSKMR